MQYQCFSAIFHLRRKFISGRKQLFYGSQSCTAFAAGAWHLSPFAVIFGKDL